MSLRARAARLAFGSLLAPMLAGAAPFTVNISNTSTNTAYGWSTGLLTLQTVISLGPTPQPGSPTYPTYTFANSQCDVSDAACSGTCNDNGNAAVLAQRLGLTLGLNAWLVPPLAANGGSATVTLDASPSQRLSFIAWVNNTGVFDDFVAIHPAGNTSTLSVPLFDASGVALENVAFEISGYDSNSTSATDGSGGTCAPACPTATTGCFVALGNASGGAGGTFPAPATPDVQNFTAVAGNTQVILRWTNVAPHDGVIVVRQQGQAVNWAPTNGSTYLPGTNFTVSGRVNTVVYADNGAGAGTTFTDTGRTNGTRYFYKIFAHANTKRYSAGLAPTSSGLFAEPTSKTGQSPLWCYSVGFASMQQPVTELGAAVFTASNSGALTASRTLAGGSDGTERFRPVQLGASVQNRPTLVPLQGRTGRYLITGDQAGGVYVVNSTSGAVAWKTASGGNSIQGQPVAQLFAYANSAFQTAQPNRDLIFVATRNTGTGATTNNRVVALSSVDGSVVWTYAPGNLDIVSGGMMVDYTNNRLWVAARAGSGAQSSVRVLNTLTGAQLAALSLGAIDYGINLDFTSQQAYVVNNAGTAYGINLSTLAQAWTLNLAATPTSWIFPLGNGFLASVTTGNGGGQSAFVRRYSVSGATVSQLWSAQVVASTTGASASGTTVDYVNQKALVGTSTGRLMQLNLATGAIEKNLVVTTVAPTNVGMPTIDSTAARTHVGTMDGRICAWPVPLP